jgi:hypothetical protein
VSELWKMKVNDEEDEAFDSKQNINRGYLNYEVLKMLGIYHCECIYGETFFIIFKYTSIICI